MTAIESPRPNVQGGRLWPLGVKAYRALGELGLIPERTELLYGQVFHKMSKSPLHRFLVMRLLAILQRVLPTGFHVQVEQPITCGDSEPEPDLSVIRGSIDDYRYEHPTTAALVIEVCVSSHEYERSKLRAYATAGVKECWLVLGPEQHIEVHHQPRDGEYTDSTLHGPGGTTRSQVVPGFAVDLAGLFAD